MADKKADLAAFFAAKGKKKAKSANLNSATKKEEAPKPKLAKDLPPTEGDWERAFRQDQEVLKSCGLWIKEVEADGACLFRAFADQIGDKGGSDHAEYRERCVDFMHSHRSDFEPFLEEDYDKYCRQMREPTTWGGQVEAQALARSLGVNALIYLPSEAAGEPANLQRGTVEILATDAADSRCVQLSYHPTHHAGQHYNSVRCLGDDGASAVPLASVTELRRRIDEALRLEEEAPVEEQEEDDAAGGKPKLRTSAKVF